MRLKHWFDRGFRPVAMVAAIAAVLGACDGTAVVGITSDGGMDANVSRRGAGRGGWRWGGA